MAERAAITVIGVGNPACGDDAAGRLVAQRLRDHCPPGVRIIECDGAATDLVDELRRARGAIIIDAASFGAPPGAVRRLDAAARCVPAGNTPSSHGLGLAEAIELARALGALPFPCLLYLVQGSVWDVGAPLSPPVAAAVPRLGDLILSEIAVMRALSSPAGDWCD
jgi:hydrogenase maturation protease